MPRSAIREVHKPETASIVEHRKKSWKTARMPHDSLDFAGVKTQYSMHGVHPYVAAINPPLASELIKHYCPEGGSVLDPFCGGGGVLLESVLAGRKATGYDVNPLAAILSNAKTHWVDPVKLSAAVDNVLHDLSGEHTEIADVPDLIRFWYSDEVAKELSSLGRLVNRVTNVNIKTLLQMVLSATARDSMLTYRGEVRLRRLRPEDEAKFAPNVRRIFMKRAALAVERISTLPRGASAAVHRADCRRIKSDEEFDCVITSPPYGDDKNGVGYFQFSRNMLHFLGFTNSALKSNRAEFLGCGSADVSAHTELSPALNAVVKACGTVSNRLRLDAERFYHDYYEALKALTHVTRERIIVVTGDRVLARTFIDNGKITADFLEALGWPLEHYYSREIRKKRIANLGGDGGQISREHVLVHRRA
jgi:hypothetical protein